MQFELLKTTNGIRVGRIETAHGVIKTPFFMPVATVGSVKGVSPEELCGLGCEIVLSNTYHLYLRPGEKLIKKLGGLHKFMRWDGPILTDSGGYQVFSLAKNKSEIRNPKSEINSKSKISNVNARGHSERNEEYQNRVCGRSNGKSLIKISDDGVEFTSHLDGSKHFFTPEKVIDIQLDLGVDILMPLDVCPSGKASKAEIEEAVRLTIMWAKRSKLHFDRLIGVSPRKNTVGNTVKEVKEAKEANFPALFGIVQGGLDQELRRNCTEELIKLDFDGYAVGGLAVDHETRDMWQTVKLMGEILPEDKPRYLMGVGTPDDIIMATQLGMDMFDCVLPTRLARHGSVYVRRRNSKIQDTITKKIPNNKSQIQKANEASAKGRSAFGGNEANSYELINLLNSKYRTDGGVMSEGCECYGCSGGFSRAYISHLIRSNEILGLRLATLHNIYIYQNLMNNLTSSSDGLK